MSAMSLPMMGSSKGRTSAPMRSPCCNIPAALPGRPRAACSLTAISEPMSARSTRVVLCWATAGQVKARRTQWGRGEGSVLGVLPLFHVFAMTAVMNLAISEGLEMILLPKFELIKTLNLISKLRPRMIPGVPTLFNAIARYPHVKNFDLSSLEFCISGGAALPLDVRRSFEALCRCHLVEGYGLSETSPVATCNPIHCPKDGSIGIPLP